LFVWLSNLNDVYLGEDNMTNYSDELIKPSEKSQGRFEINYYAEKDFYLKDIALIHCDIDPNIFTNEEIDKLFEGNAPSNTDNIEQIIINKKNNDINLEDLKAAQFICNQMLGIVQRYEIQPKTIFEDERIIGVDHFVLSREEIAQLYDVLGLPLPKMLTQGKIGERFNSSKQKTKQKNAVEIEKSASETSNSAQEKPEQVKPNNVKSKKKRVHKCFSQEMTDDIESFLSDFKEVDDGFDKSNLECLIGNIGQAIIDRADDYPSFQGMKVKTFKERWSRTLTRDLCTFSPTKKDNPLYFQKLTSS
jgi:hypothetical protein